LPLPTELRDDTTVSYNSVNLETVGDFLDPNRGAAGLGSAAMLRNIGSLGQLAISGTSKGFERALGGRGALAEVAGMAAGGFLSAVQALVPPEQVSSAVQQKMGAAPNPNPSVQFQGPVLRDFTLTWAFYPKNAAESTKIDTLIRRLKARALPSNNEGNNGAVLNYPHICQLNFYPWDSSTVPDPDGWSPNSIIKIKKCFMSGVNVNYNAFGTPGFFEGTKLPISYQLTINFKEIEYLLSGDWDPDKGLAASERNVAQVTPDQVAIEGGRIIFGTAGAVALAGFNTVKEVLLNEIPSQAELDNIDNVDDALRTLKPPKEGEAETKVTIRAEAKGFLASISTLDIRGAGVATITQNAAGKYVLVFDEDDVAANAKVGGTIVTPPETLGTFDTLDELNAFLREDRISTTGVVTFPPRPAAAAPAP